MCPQAALPDLNTAWIMDKREFLNAIKNRGYTAVVGSLLSINAALPDNYIIKVSDKEYEKITQLELLYVCPVCKLKCQHCKTGKGDKCDGEYNRKDVTIKDSLTSHTISTITGMKEDKIWKCKKCNTVHLLSKTLTIQPKLAEPHFLKVVPNPPSRTGSLTDRNLYHIKMERWAYQFYYELAHQMSLFRLEYKPRDEGSEENEFMNADDEIT